MKDLAQRALDSIEVAGAGYGDIRITQARHEEISVKNGSVDGLVDDFSEGFGIRVLVDGAWGFACSSTLSATEVDAVVGRAMSVARASARVHLHPVDLGPAVVSRGGYRGAAETDPFSVGLDRKVDMLLEVEKSLRREGAIRVAEASCECTHWEKLFASTEGSLVEQEAWETGAGIEATAVDDDDMQKRSYPNSFGREVGQGGWELVEAMELRDHAPGCRRRRRCCWAPSNAPLPRPP